MLKRLPAELSLEPSAALVWSASTQALCAAAVDYPLFLTLTRPVWILGLGLSVSPQLPVCHTLTRAGKQSTDWHNLDQLIFADLLG